MQSQMISFGCCTGEFLRLFPPPSQRLIFVSIILSLQPLTANCTLRWSVSSANVWPSVSRPRDWS